MGVNRLIIIRTDANKEIATGHMMRCLAVADACLQKGIQVCFVVSDEESKSVLEALVTDRVSSPLTIQVLQTALYNNLEKELPELTDTIVTKGASVLLLDSYFVTPAYLEAVSKVTRIAYIDDLRAFDYKVDLLINYDIIPDEKLSEYQNSYQNAEKCLLGGLYTPLRSQFKHQQFVVRDFSNNNHTPDLQNRQRPSVLVTTGGSDPYHFCLHFLEAAKHLPLTFHVVIGKMNTDKKTLMHLAEQCHKSSPCATHCNVILHENVSDMASLMADCDFAVSAAGTTLYELCALGVPCVSFTMADNQLVAARAFDSQGAVYLAGDIRPARDFSLRNSAFSYRPEINDDAVNRIVNCAEEMTLMSDNYIKRKSAHEAMRRLVDCNGASRIAEALLLCTE